MIGAVVQARMDSKRLPGKVLMELGDKPMMQWVIEAALRSKVEKVVVLVTNDPRDGAIAELCGRIGIDYVIRDEPDDVLGGFYKVATRFQFDPIVRLCGDCPLVSTYVINAVVDGYTFMKGCDYCSNAANLEHRTFPRGVEAEVFSYAVLKWMHENLTSERTPYGRYHPDYREHVTFYIRENPHVFTTRHMYVDLNRLRLVVDTLDEYEKMRTLFDRMGDRPSWLKAVELIEEYPELAMLETPSSQKPVKWRVW